jgi:hypothetical protein
MENEDLYRNLVILLKMFKNRPFHLAKYLIENSALTEEFIKKVMNNNSLKDLVDSNDPKGKNLFLDINQMNNYFNSLTDDIKRIGDSKNPEEISAALNEKLETLINEERYEDAAKLRDYMIKNNIKRIK